jgi:hypothetical protein
MKKLLLILLFPCLLFAQSKQKIKFEEVKLDTIGANHAGDYVTVSVPLKADSGATILKKTIMDSMDVNGIGRVDTLKSAKGGEFNGIISNSINTSDYTNTGGANSQFLMTNPSATGQNVISSFINGNLVAKWRTDYDGNVNWISGNGYHQFYTKGDYPTGTMRAKIDSNGVNTDTNYSFKSGYQSYNLSKYSSISGDYDTSYATPSFGNIHIQGNHITVGRDNPSTTYGVWAYGSRLRAENLGLWLFGAYDGAAPYPIIPFQGSVVFVNEDIRHWLSNPMGLYAQRISMQTSSPHTRDTIAFAWAFQKGGSQDDSLAHGIYYLMRNLSPDISGTRIQHWDKYRSYLSFNSSGFDDIHVNINANDTDTKPWGQVTVDNGQFGVMHGNNFTAGTWDAADSANVFHWSNHFYGQTRFDSSVVLGSTINGYTLNNGSAADTVEFGNKYFAKTDSNTTKNPITLSYAIANYSPIAGSASIVTTGALNAGSITSGFGAIDIGTDALTCGTITFIGSSGESTVGDKHAVGARGETFFHRTSEDANGLAGMGVEVGAGTIGGNQSNIKFYGWDYGINNSAVAMTIKGGGHVLVGSTVSDGVNLLQVNGGGYFNGTLTLPNSNVLTGNTNSLSISKGLHVGGTSDVADNDLIVDGTTTTTQFKLSALNTAPANAGDTGTLGEIRVVDGFIYVCTATNTWKRCAIATW